MRVPLAVIIRKEEIAPPSPPDNLIQTWLEDREIITVPGPNPFTIRVCHCNPDVRTTIGDDRH